MSRPPARSRSGRGWTADGLATIESVKILTRYRAVIGWVTFMVARAVFRRVLQKRREAAAARMRRRRLDPRRLVSRFR
jgi:Trk-type K+ transport system membrane component